MPVTDHEVRDMGLTSYPRETPFETVEEALAYLDQPRIVCLRCGKRYRALGRHLNVAHGWTAREYKHFYALPYQRGLSCAEIREFRRALGLRVTREWPLEGARLEHVLASRDPKSEPPHTSIFASRQSGRNSGDYEHRPWKWTPANYEAVLDRMEEQSRTLMAVTSDPDMPSRPCVQRFCNATPKFAARLNAICEPRRRAICTVAG